MKKNKNKNFFLLLINVYFCDTMYDTSLLCDIIHIEFDSCTYFVITLPCFERPLHTP